MQDKCILLVEDDAGHEALMLRALKKSDIMGEVVVLRDGAEALDYLFGTGTYAGRNKFKTPQVVFLDLKLPKVDGLEVLKRLRADYVTRLIPVVVLSSSSEENDLMESYKRGANSYVRKPMDFSQFAESVGRLGHYWLNLNESPLRPGIFG